MFQFVLRFYVTVKDDSAIFVTAHGCAGGLKKKLNLWSGFQCDRHFIGFLLCPSKAPARGNTFPTSSEKSISDSSFAQWDSTND